MLLVKLFSTHSRVHTTHQAYHISRTGVRHRTQCTRSRRTRRRHWLRARATAAPWSLHRRKLRCLKRPARPAPSPGPSPPKRSDPRSSRSRPSNKPSALRRSASSRKRSAAPKQRTTIRTRSATNPSPNGSTSRNGRRSQPVKSNAKTHFDAYLRASSIYRALSFNV